MTHLVGTVGQGVLAEVDPDGTVRPWRTEWTLSWWVGAEDRWHLPELERVVRQRRIEGAPVIETAMRVPGGDAVERVYGVVGPGAGGDAVVVEVANESPVPVAVGFAVKGGDPDQVLSFSREPARDARVPGLRVSVLPVPHRTAVRAVVGTRSVDPARLPDAGTVAAGWREHLDRGARIDVPDPALSAARVEHRADLLLRGRDAAAGRLATREAADLVEPLDREGFAPEAAAILHELGEHRRLNGLFGRGDTAVSDTAAVLRAFAGHWFLARDRESIDPYVGTLAKAATRLARRGEVRDAVDGIVALLDGAGQPLAARRLARRLGDGRPAPAWPVSHTPTVHRERRTPNGRFELGLLPDLSPAWYGQPVEAHHVPTVVGPVSFAVRWHGPRPALLWELLPWPDAPEVTITVPGLDPAWQTSEASGEALLEAPEVVTPT